MLVALSGLPGVGKTTIARTLARETGAVHLRVDSIEQALRNAGIRVESEGYVVAYAIAADNAHDLRDPGRVEPVFRLLDEKDRGELDVRQGGEREKVEEAFAHRIRVNERPVVKFDGDLFRGCIHVSLADLLSLVQRWADARVTGVPNGVSGARRRGVSRCRAS